jgi:hypothetical protein
LAKSKLLPLFGEPFESELVLEFELPPPLLLLLLFPLLLVLLLLLLLLLGWFE